MRKIIAVLILFYISATSFAEETKNPDLYISSFAVSQNNDSSISSLATTICNRGGYISDHNGKLTFSLYDDKGSGYTLPFTKEIELQKSQCKEYIIGNSEIAKLDNVVLKVVKSQVKIESQFDFDLSNNVIEYRPTQSGAILDTDYAYKSKVYDGVYNDVEVLIKKGVIDMTEGYRVLQDYKDDIYIRGISADEVRGYADSFVKAKVFAHNNNNYSQTDLYQFITDTLGKGVSSGKISQTQYTKTLNHYYQTIFQDTTNVSVYIYDEFMKSDIYNQIISLPPVSSNRVYFKEVQSVESDVIDQNKFRITFGNFDKERDTNVYLCVLRDRNEPKFAHSRCNAMSLVQSSIQDVWLSKDARNIELNRYSNNRNLDSSSYVTMDTYNITTNNVTANTPSLTTITSNISTNKTYDSSLSQNTQDLIMRKINSIDSSRREQWALGVINKINILVVKKSWSEKDRGTLNAIQSFLQDYLEQNPSELNVDSLLD